MVSITLVPESKIVVIKINNIKRALPGHLEKSLYMIGKRLTDRARKNILKKNRRGRVYSYKGRRHVASVPGESWANRSGKALRGIFYKVSSPLRAEFGNRAQHAIYLEDGTKKMARRPAHEISIRQNEKNIITIVERHMRLAF